MGYLMQGLKKEKHIEITEKLIIKLNIKVMKK